MRNVAGSLYELSAGLPASPSFDLSSPKINITISATTPNAIQINFLFDLFLGGFGVGSGFGTGSGFGFGFWSCLAVGLDFGIGGTFGFLPCNFSCAHFTSCDAIGLSHVSSCKHLNTAFFSSGVHCLSNAGISAPFFCANPPSISINGTSPSSSSYIVAPSAHTSLAIIGVGSSLNRSGGEYATVIADCTLPMLLRNVLRARALIPKSVILYSPLLFINTLSGLIS